MKRLDDLRREYNESNEPLAESMDTARARMQREIDVVALAVTDISDATKQLWELLKEENPDLGVLSTLFERIMTSAVRIRTLLMLEFSVSQGNDYSSALMAVEHEALACLIAHEGSYESFRLNPQDRSRFAIENHALSWKEGRLSQARKALGNVHSLIEKLRGNMKLDTILRHVEPLLNFPGQIRQHPLFIQQQDHRRS